MIKLIPSKVEAYEVDDTGEFIDGIFTAESDHDSACTVKITTSITKSNVEEILAAIRDAVKMLELE